MFQYFIEQKFVVREYFGAAMWLIVNDGTPTMHIGSFNL
jgi:hypothetical protein